MPVALPTRHKQPDTYALRCIIRIIGIMLNEHRKITWAVNLADTLESKTRDAILEDLRRQTDAGTELAMPHAWAQAGITWFQPRADIPWLSETSGPTPPKDELDNWLEAARHSKRATAWRWRVGEAMDTLAGQQRWYPVHVTLTVDPTRAEPYTIISDKRQWDKYCARWRAQIRQATGLQLHTPVAEYQQHCAVIEHGKTREHHHIHAIFWAKDLPETWKIDPNRGRPGQPTARNIPGIKALWDHAIVTTAEPFRFLGDPWETHGWMIPIKNGQPMLLTTARKAGAYLAKYLSKEDKAWRHNVHATRALGMHALRAALAEMNTPALHALQGAINPIAAPAAASCAVPNQLVRDTAQTTITARLWPHRDGRRAILAHAQQPRPNAYGAMRKHTQEHRPERPRRDERDRPILELWRADTDHVAADLWMINPRSTDNEPAELQQAAWSALAARWPKPHDTSLRPLAGVAS